MQNVCAALITLLITGCSLNATRTGSDPDPLVVLSPGSVRLSVTSKLGPITQLSIAQPAGWTAKVDSSGTTAGVTISGIVPAGTSQKGVDIVLVKSAFERGPVHLKVVPFTGREFSKFLNPQEVSSSVHMDADDGTQHVLDRLNPKMDRSLVTLSVRIVDPGPNPIGTGWNQNFLWHWGDNDSFICHNLTSPISFGSEPKGEAMLAAWQAKQLQMDPRGNYSPRRCETSPPTGKRAIALSLTVN